MKAIRISCLPVAGKMNPYQHLMMQGLSADGRCIARNGYKDRLTGILRTAIGKPSDYMHFDWIDGLYARRNPLFMYVNIALFVTQLWLVKHIFRTRIVCTLHNLRPHDDTQAIHHRMHKWFYKQCSWIRVFSSSTAQKAAQLYAIPLHKFKVIPAGSYRGYYPDQITPVEAKKALRVEKYSRVYLCFGNIRPYKGLEEFIPLFDQLAGDDELLLVVGRSPDTQFGASLRALAGNKVRFELSFIRDEDVQIYFRAADVVVAPFVQIENSGSVVLAMDFGKTILAPAAGILPEYLQCQSTLLYPQGQLSTYFAKVQILTDDELSGIGACNQQAAGQYSFTQFTEAFTNTV